jgi:hypothetical protein
MMRIGSGSTLAGAGAIAFGVLTVVGTFGGSPGGSYDQPTVVEYVKGSHFPLVVMTGYLAILGVVGLICLLAYLRGLIGVDPDRTLGATIFWGIGLASAASFAVAWGLVTGIALSAAEGGSGASVPPAVTYVLGDTSLNVLFGSGGILLGFAMIALFLSTPARLPSWLRWTTLVAGILALGAPFFFPAFAIPLWAIVIGVWLVTSRSTRSSATMRTHPNT